MLREIDLTQFTTTAESNWHGEFSLWLRQTPSQKKKMRSGLSLEAYERDIKLMAAWYEEKYAMAFEPCQMNIQNVGEYFSLFENAPATHKRKLASLRLLIRWGMAAELIDQDPSAWISYVDVVEEAPRDLNDEEREMLEMAAEENESTLIGMRDSVIFFLMIDAGLRISEVIGLNLSDLHLDEGYIHVLGKGSKHRQPRIASRLIGKLRLWLDRMPVSVEGTVVTDEQGLAIGRKAAWTRFCLLRDMAGVNATPHSLRHTYVIQLMNAYVNEFMQGSTKGVHQAYGKALKIVCHQTGDDEKTILKYYNNPSDSEIRAAVEAMYR